MQKTSCFHVFFEKDNFSFSVHRKNIFEKNRCLLSWWYKKDHIPVWFFFGKTIFSEHLKKISYFHVFNIQKTSCFHVFFEKDHISFFAQRIRSHFLEEEISSFLMIQETSYSRAIYLERLFFLYIWKKNMVFRAVQVLWAKHCHHIWSNLCHDMSYSIAETTRLW